MNEQAENQCFLLLSVLFFFFPVFYCLTVFIIWNENWKLIYLDFRQKWSHCWNRRIIKMLWAGLLLNIDLARTHCSGPGPIDLWYFQGCRCLSLSRQLVQGYDHLDDRFFFFYIKLRFPILQFVSIASYSICATKQMVAASFFKLPVM